jgi:hypothetical protein
MPTVDYNTELLRVLQAVNAPDMERAGIGTPLPAEDSTEEEETVGAPDPVGSLAVPVPPTNVTAKTVFSHPDSHPVVLDLIMLHKYAAEWLEWEPETVQLLVGRDFGSFSDLNFSKVMAMKTLHLVDSYWEQWEIFNWCTMSLNGIFPDFEVMQAPTVAQAMVSADIANRVREDVPWSEEVRVFLGVVHRSEGIFLAQPPLEDAIIDLSGTTVDLAAVKEQWPAVRVSGKAPTAETVEAEQLRRMLTTHEFLLESRNKLRAQIHLVQSV